MGRETEDIETPTSPVYRRPRHDTKPTPQQRLRQRTMSYRRSLNDETNILALSGHLSASSLGSRHHYTSSSLEFNSVSVAKARRSGCFNSPRTVREALQNPNGAEMELVPKSRHRHYGSVILEGYWTPSTDIRNGDASVSPWMRIDHHSMSPSEIVTRIERFPNTAALERGERSISITVALEQDRTVQTHRPRNQFVFILSRAYIVLL